MPAQRVWISRKGIDRLRKTRLPGKDRDAEFLSGMIATPVPSVWIGRLGIDRLPSSDSFLEWGLLVKNHTDHVTNFLCNIFL